MLALGLFALQLLPACSNDAASSTETPLPAASIDDLEQTLDGVVAEGVAPGVSATVERPGFQAWSGAAGVRNLETDEALTPSERFRAGSMPKTAVAVAVLQLVEQGELAFEANLTELLPESIASRIPDATEITCKCC